MVRDVEKPHVSFKAYNCIKIILYVSIHSYLNRHIFKWYIEKGVMSIASRRIDKCPTPKQRFSDKFPTARTDKMTNSWQIPTGDGHAWNWLSHYHYHLKQIFVSFHWPRAHHVTCKQLPTNNGLLMRNVVYLCLKLANNLFNIEDQQFGHFLID